MQYARAEANQVGTVTNLQLEYSNALAVLNPCLAARTEQSGEFEQHAGLILRWGTQ